MQGKIPDWYYLADLVNPMSVYSALITLNIGSIGSGFSSMGTPTLEYPGFYTSGLMILILCIWIIGFLALAYWRFYKKDI